MEIMQLESSFDDDEDVYLNSVAKLKALKKKQPSANGKEKKEVNGVQEQNEGLKIDNTNKARVTRRKKNKPKNKRNVSKLRPTKQRQKKDVIDSESDLEIVSVEGKIHSSENDVLIVEKNIQENLQNSEDENYEINIKILWRSKEVHRLNIRRNEDFGQIFEYFANIEQVPINEILITRKDQTIKKNDSPASINLSVIDILEGGIVKKDIDSQKNVGPKLEEDACIIKVQTISKNYIIISVKQNENFNTLFKKCAEELNVEESKIKLYFDGELVTTTDTPNSLEIEDEGCFDLQLCS